MGFGKQTLRIDWDPVDPDFPMNMFPCRIACAAHPAYLLPLLDILPICNRRPGEMAKNVEFQAIIALDSNMQPITYRTLVLQIGLTRDRCHNRDVFCSSHVRRSLIQAAIVIAIAAILLAGKPAISVFFGILDMPLEIAGRDAPAWAWQNVSAHRDFRFLCSFGTLQTVSR